jgi:hypothetical protein
MEKRSKRREEARRGKEGRGGERRKGCATHIVTFGSWRIWENV